MSVVRAIADPMPPATPHGSAGTRHAAKASPARPTAGDAHAHARRRMLRACAVLALAGPAHERALAQAYPSRPIRFVNNAAPGGPSDLIARALAESMRAHLGQPIVVEDRAGAAGNVGAEHVARSEPDGHTVLFGVDSTFTVNPHLYASMPFKPGDLVPVAITASTGLLLGVRPASGIRTFDELVARARAAPMTFGSPGNGSPAHFAAALLAEATGARITHVAYRGNAPAVTALVAGEIDAGVLAMSGMLPQVRAGRIVPLAVTSAERSSLAPEIATLRELGHPDLVHEVLFLAMVPAATPEPVLRTLREAMLQALGEPAMRARLAAMDMRVVGTSGETASRTLQGLSERYRAVIARTGMKAD